MQIEDAGDKPSERQFYLVYALVLFTTAFRVAREAE